jgi:hypothetical protein
MSITIDDKTVDIFKIFDELTQTYSKEIDGYKTLTKAIEVMIDQKERELQGIKDKTLALLQVSIPYPETTVSREAPQIIEYENVADTDFEVEALEIQDAQIEKPPVAESETLEHEIIQAETPPVRKTRTRKQHKQAVKKKGKVSLKDLAVGKTESNTKAPRSQKPVQDKKNLKCLYHPESPAVDMQRQLCSSCRWKLKTYGLMEYFNEPAVVSYLKGETKTIPNVGQSMCPNHPEKPSYNKKTGLCQYCQRKARVIGVTDRQLTEEELELVRNTDVQINEHDSILIL